MRVEKVRELFHLPLTHKIQKSEALTFFLVNGIDGQSLRIEMRLEILIYQIKDVPLTIVPLHVRAD